MFNLQGTPTLTDCSVLDECGSNEELLSNVEADDFDADLDEKEYDGLDWLDSIETQDAKQGVANWRITAVGNRPQDHMARDFLFGSLLRDFRPTWYHQYAKEPAEWMLPLIRHLRGQGKRMLGVQHLALHVLHRRSLLQQIQLAWNPPTRPEMGSLEHYAWVMAGMPLTPPVDPPECRQLALLWRCWPFGVQVEWQGPGQRTERDICGQTWYCPWCLARKVVALHDRLRSSVLQDSAGKHLMLLRASLPINRFIEQVDEGRLRRGPRRGIAIVFQRRPDQGHHRLAAGCRPTGFDDSQSGGGTEGRVRPAVL